MSEENRMSSPVNHVDVDSEFYRVMGYRDCGQEALRFLTEKAQLSPTNPVVQGVQRIIDSVPPVNVVQSLPHHGDRRDVDNRRLDRKRRRCRRRLLEGGICSRPYVDRRSAVAEVCSSGSDRRVVDRLCPLPHVETLLRCRDVVQTSTCCQSVPTAATASSTECRLPSGISTYPERSALRTIQSPATASNGSGTKLNSARRDHVIEPTPEVLECAGVLAGLARSHAKVGSLLSELMELMDSDTEN